MTVHALYQYTCDVCGEEHISYHDSAPVEWVALSHESAGFTFHYCAGCAKTHYAPVRRRGELRQGPYR